MLLSHHLNLLLTHKGIFYPFFVAYYISVEIRYRNNCDQVGYDGVTTTREVFYGVISQGVALFIIMEKKKIVVIICIAVSVISIFMIICQTKNNKEKDEFANAAVKTTATIEKIVTEKSIKWSRRNRRSGFRTVTTYYALASYEVLRLYEDFF